MPIATRRASAFAPPIRISYAAELPASDDRLLAAFAFGESLDPDRATPLALTTRDGIPAYEIWRSAGSVTRANECGARIAYDGQLLFAAWTLDEAAHDGVEAAAEFAYRRIAELTAKSGYIDVIKVWHYFGAINDGAGDAERYRRFCVGRARGIVDGARLPAATAIGVQSAPFRLTVFMLAAKTPGLPIENPRQVPAFEYPRAYGPASPSFSRAMLMPWGQLFVSGTAAVVGHESCHADNAGAQLRELALNLDALVARAEVLGGQKLQPQALKFYVRRADDVAAIEALAARLFPGDCPRLSVLADICRTELQVEVEALYDPV